MEYYTRCQNSVVHTAELLKLPKISRGMVRLFMFKLDGVGPPLITDPPPTCPTALSEKEEEKKKKKKEKEKNTHDTRHLTPDT